jgi:hypothetical protein
MRSHAALEVAPSGRVSQVPDRSFDTRRPQPPRRVRPVHLLVATRTMAGFTILGGLTTLT